MPNFRPTEGFNTRRYRLLRVALMAECRRTGRGCHFCGEAFDWVLIDSKAWRHPRYFHAHHDPPLAHGGPAADPAHMYPSHKICNERYGTGMLTSTVDAEMPHSEEWP